MNILCKLGLHNTVFKEKWLPDIGADIVEEVHFQIVCKRCGKIKYLEKWYWNKGSSYTRVFVEKYKQVYYIIGDDER